MSNESEMNKKVRKNIATLRKKKGLSQSELSANTNIENALSYIFRSQ